MGAMVWSGPPEKRYSGHSFGGASLRLCGFVGFFSDEGNIWQWHSLHGGGVTQQSMRETQRKRERERMSINGDFSPQQSSCKNLYLIIRPQWHLDPPLGALLPHVPVDLPCGHVNFGRQPSYHPNHISRRMCVLAFPSPYLSCSLLMWWRSAGVTQVMFIELYLTCLSQFPGLLWMFSKLPKRFTGRLGGVRAQVHVPGWGLLISKLQLYF